jgi:hypothetical protein
MLQTISVVGALAILGAYAAGQFGLADASKLSYQAANFLGSAALSVVAVVDWQLGFILLEGAWALMSLWGIAAILRGARRPRGGAAKPRSSKARSSKGVFGGGV